MARAKIDGVVEAVRYAPGGEVALVRVYERHGVVWSDRIMLERKDLVERLQKGKRYVIGERKEFLGGVFKTGLVVGYVNQHLVADGQAAAQDQLRGVPIF